ncbi:MAG: hypothetical protein JRI23_07705 [Deltaproteobacteria bacterium]|jgi:hypothetical protein|nr:hypothetical protein [Deltaproteobacteria bacterium]MBW2531490.1 hypothetical protein [Deltaproteobacteria bacterium]
MVALHEGPEPERWLPIVMESNEPAAKWLRDMIAEIHDMDPGAGPPPPAGELIADTSAD